MAMTNRHRGMLLDLLQTEFFFPGCYEIKC